VCLLGESDWSESSAILLRFKLFLFCLMAGEASWSLLRFFDSGFFWDFRGFRGVPVSLPWLPESPADSLYPGTCEFSGRTIKTEGEPRLLELQLDEELLDLDMELELELEEEDRLGPACDSNWVPTNSDESPLCL
jgi:hypothetical protein